MQDESAQLVEEEARKRVWNTYLELVDIMGWFDLFSSDNVEPKEGTEGGRLCWPIAPVAGCKLVRKKEESNLTLLALEVKYGVKIEVVAREGSQYLLFETD